MSLPFFLTYTPPLPISPLSLHDALPILPSAGPSAAKPYVRRKSSGISMRRNASICHCGEPYQTESVPHSTWSAPRPLTRMRSEEHTSELQSPYDLVCRLLLEKKKTQQKL